MARHNSRKFEGKEKSRASVMISIKALIFLSKAATDLMEKHKEKRHKKDKKERKEKKDKERNEDKHKEKKERKEKHKDKKKDRDKSKALDERNTVRQAESYDGGKPAENSQKQAEEVNDSKFVEELGRRLCDGERGTKNQVAEIFTCRAEASGKGDWQKDIANKDNNIHDRKTGEHRNRDHGGGFGSEMFRSFKAADHRSEEGTSREVGRDVANKETNFCNKKAEHRNKNQNTNSGVATIRSFTGVDQRRAEGIDRMADMATGNNGKKVDDRTTDGQRNQNPDARGGIATSKSFMGTDQRKAETIAKPTNNNAEKRMEGKEKFKENESGNKHGDKQKDRDREKKSMGNDTNLDKEKEKEMEKAANRSKSHEQLHENKEVIHTHNTKFLQIPLHSTMVAATVENSKKRKVIETNGSLYDIDVQPNKLPRHADLSHPYTENGGNLEPYQTSNQHSSVVHGGINSLKVGGKFEKVTNGVVECQLSSVKATRPSSAASGETSAKKPHPDSKYLSKILSVPSMEEWSDFDDQDWLFSNDPKPKTVSSGVEDTVNVWDKAQWIESAEVFALPYVIPY
ncbi:hypothetical protein GIB67_028969 [Kingdonia uniflora]|uniref:Uncharacterized protein n=1 Tax=Kingdonia uniflora TaxID=39325 RepID=A0A7J7LC23_9MAGN|nr:hypothetical protein GIB67_028969 [Kingdonia uniflora]